MRIITAGLHNNTTVTYAVCKLFFVYNCFSTVQCLSSSVRRTTVSSLSVCHRLSAARQCHPTHILVTKKNVANGT